MLVEMERWETRKIFPIMYLTPCDNSYILAVEYREYIVIAKYLQSDWLKQRTYFWYFYWLQCKYQWNVKRKKAKQDIQST